MAGSAFALILAGTILGAIVRSRLPEHHLTGDSKEVIRLATALVALLLALAGGPAYAGTIAPQVRIGRASCRERVSCCV